MSADLQIERELLSPPGDTIQETLDEIGMSQAELAERMGRPKEKVNGLIKGKEPLTMKTAVLLERVLHIPVRFWMERERKYREELTRIEQQEFLESQSDWLLQFPLREMKKMGWLPDTRDRKKLVEALLKFFGVASSKEWEKIYLSDSLSTAFKISLAHTKSPYALSTWLRIGELKAAEKDLNPYDEKGFKQVLDEIKDSLVMDQPEDFKEQLQALCAKHGVVVVYTPCLPKAPISGATWRKGGNPIIQLSGRYKTNDSFWFAFYHEAAHVLKHGRKEVFLEDLEGSPRDEQKEKEADQFAQKFLFPESALKKLSATGKPTDQDIQDYAQKYHTHPAIIVGQLQHRGMLSYREKNHFKVAVEITAISQA